MNEVQGGRLEGSQQQAGAGPNQRDTTSVPTMYKLMFIFVGQNCLF